MKKLSYILPCLLSLFLSTSLYADPIQDMSINLYEATWVKSVSTSCPQVCKDSEYQIYSENEKVVHNASHTKLTFTCKGTSKGQLNSHPIPSRNNSNNAHPAEYKGWLYGNNFYGGNLSRYCIVSTPYVKAKKLTRFYCLCVHPAQ